MTPQEAYKRLNRLLWDGRLPAATIVIVDHATMPTMHGVTMNGHKMFMKPIILLNHQTPWGLTLVHEMLHVAEPVLEHGKIFDGIVTRYWRYAKKHIPGIQKRRTLKPTPSEKTDENVPY